MTVDFLGRSLYYYRVHVLPALIIDDDDEEEEEDVVIIEVEVIIDFPTI